MTDKARIKEIMPSVLAFSNYREFLSEVFTLKKESGFNLVKFSKFLGFKSPNYAGLVLSGKRNLTTANVVAIAKALKFTFSETEYLEAMVQNNQSSSSEEARYFARRMKALRENQPKSSIRLSSTDLLSEWYFPAIVALVDRTKTDEALNKITSALPIDAKRATQILNLLSKEGLIQVQGEKYALNYSHQIFFDEKSMSQSHKKYLLSQLDLSRKVFLRSYEKGAKFYSQTVSLEKDDLPFFEDKIRNLLAEFVTRSDETKPDGAVQINIQLFPIELSSNSWT